MLDAAMGIPGIGKAPIRIDAMFSRALIVLLLVLNVGVAAWWAVRAVPQPPAVVQPEGIARLQLLREMPPGARPKPRAPVAPPAVAATTTPVEPVAVAPQCFSFGPYADAAAASAARARLQPLVQRIAPRAQAAPARGWRVYLPRLPTLDAAQAMAQRIAAAGFSDYLVLREGADANSIALGRYGSEGAARERVARLVAAGFPARAEPLPGGSATTWLDVAAAAGFDAARAQALASAPQRAPLDCTRLR
jgi:hypothetical protein